MGTPESVVDLSAPVNGGPFDGARATLAAPDPELAQHHLWLMQVAGQWHAYQLVPLPDSDRQRVWSHLGEVSRLPVLDQSG